VRQVSLVHHSWKQIKKVKLMWMRLTWLKYFVQEIQVTLYAWDFPIINWNILIHTQIALFISIFH
jgi:hypothetical protein